MKLVSVNVGKPRAIKAKSGVSGIYKEPQTAPVYIDELGLEDDAICDTDNHGGVDQAVYLFGTTDYEWWSNELGKTLEPGTFGENLTITDLESADYHIGDRLRVGEVLLEVTYPRIPCVTLAVRMGDPKFLKRFRNAERFGLYCRVLEQGAVSVGDPVTVEHVEHGAITALKMFRDFYRRNPNSDQ